MGGATTVAAGDRLVSDVREGEAALGEAAISAGTGVRLVSDARLEGEAALGEATTMAAGDRLVSDGAFAVEPA